MVRLMLSGQGPIFFLLHIIKMQSPYVENHVFIKIIRKEEKQEGEDIWIKMSSYKNLQTDIFKSFFYKKSRHTAIASKTSPK